MGEYCIVYNHESDLNAAQTSCELLVDRFRQWWIIYIEYEEAERV